MPDCSPQGSSPAIPAPSCPRKCDDPFLPDEYCEARLYKKIARFNVRTGDCCFRTDGEPGWDWDEKEEMHAAEILNGGGSRTGRGLPMQHPCLKRSFKKLFVVPMPSVANKSHARNIVFELESATSFFASVSVPIRWTMNVMKTSSPAPSPNTGSSGM